MNVNELLGFEVGDLVIGREAVPGRGDRASSKGPTKRHGCPSHGIGLTPDEKELWLTDAFNSRMHIFDATVMPPKQVADDRAPRRAGLDHLQHRRPVRLSVDRRRDRHRDSRKIVAALKDETGRDVQSEKMVEIDFRGDEPVRAGDQFGLGRRTSPARGTSVRREADDSQAARQRALVVAAGRLISRASVSSRALPRRSSRMMVPSGSIR